MNDTATNEIYTLALHEALPICKFGKRIGNEEWVFRADNGRRKRGQVDERRDERSEIRKLRKSWKSKNEKRTETNKKKIK